jgi:hypothetical protein
MPALLSGIILVAVFAALAALAGLLAVAAFRRAGTREVSRARGQRLS